MNFIPRNIELALKNYLKIFPIVALTGPRQSGKSTLLKNTLASEYKYVTFDDYQMIELFSRDPIGFFQTYNNKVIFDEVHKVPEIFNYLKIAVDNDRQNYGKYILTASAQFQMMAKVTESLAGRIGILNLFSFDYFETPAPLRHESIYKGSYPEIIVRNYDGNEQWYSSYLETYVQRDVRALSNVGEIRDFRRLVQLLATRTSQILNMSEISKQLGISLSTIKRWLSVLEASFIIFLLPPYYENLGKRITKAPKIYFYDTGLVAFLTGIQNEELYKKGPMFGSLFENFVVSKILKREKHNATNAELYYYRTNHGVEVDLIIDRKHSKEVIEIKNNSTFRTKMIHGIEFLSEALKQNGYLIYTGEDLQISSNLFALNFDSYLIKKLLNTN